MDDDVKRVKKLSPTMVTALRMSADGGLVRYDGGFWVGAKVKVRMTDRGYPAPAESTDPYPAAVPHTTKLTLRALESRRLLELDPEDGAQPWRARRVLTDLGRRVLEQLEAESA